MRWSKTTWYLRQIVPSKYHSLYREGENLTVHFTTWWMWGGRVFWVRDRCFPMQ